MSVKTPEEVLFQHPKPDAGRVARTHEVQRIEVAHDPAMSFGLLVPRSMVAAVPTTYVAPEHGRPEPLALFGVPNVESGPRVVVSGQILEWEVDPLEWLRWLWVRDGWRIALAQVHSGKGGPRYEIAALREREGTVTVRRCMAFRSGPRLVRCDVSSTLHAWSQWHDALWWTLDGFHLGRPRRAPVEALVGREGPLLAFGVPGSWDVRGEGNEVEGMVWAARPMRDVQRGATLRVEARRLETAPPAAERRGALWRSMREAGLGLGAVLTAEREAFAELVPGWIGQWQAGLRSGKGDGVAVLVQREDQGVAMDYVLVAPAAGTEHLDWMRATRALDVAISTSDPRAPKQGRAG